MFDMESSNSMVLGFGFWDSDTEFEMQTNSIFGSLLGFSTGLVIAPSIKNSDVLRTSNAGGSSSKSSKNSDPLDPDSKNSDPLDPESKNPDP